VKETLEILGDSKLSRKFQITVPKDVRDILRLGTGDRLVFVAEKDRILVKRGELHVEDLRQLKSKEGRETN
jgi:AbrB family looped-hinge helix DNA binding protein